MIYCQVSVLLIYLFILFIIIGRLRLLIDKKGEDNILNIFSSILSNLGFLKKKLDGKSNNRDSFFPVKIIDNDNELEKIVPDFEYRKQQATQELESRLGKALPNGVIWSILQKLYSEFFLKDHKIILNTEYQRGLLLQKEKKYNQAISHYASGLYYLMNFYQADFNPTAHIINMKTSNQELIEMAQNKFINKIQLCMKYGNMNLDEVKRYSLFFIHDDLPNLSSNNFIETILSYIKRQNKKPEKHQDLILKLNTSNNDKFYDDDITEGLEFHATLQFRTPLEVLVHDGEIYRGKGQPPQYTKEAWQGMWLPKLRDEYDLPRKRGVSTDIGYLEGDERNNYLDFLIKFHTIAESELRAEEKIIKIRQLLKSDSKFRTFYNKMFGENNDFLESYFNLLIRNIVPSKAAQILYEEGFKTLNDLRGVDKNDLLKLKGIGQATIKKLEEYF